MVEAFRTTLCATLQKRARPTSSLVPPIEPRSQFVELETSSLTRVYSTERSSLARASEFNELDSGSFPFFISVLFSLETVLIGDESRRGVGHGELFPGHPERHGEGLPLVGGLAVVQHLDGLGRAVVPPAEDGGLEAEGGEAVVVAALDQVRVEVGGSPLAWKWGTEMCRF